MRVLIKPTIESLLTFSHQVVRTAISEAMKRNVERNFGQNPDPNKGLDPNPFSSPSVLAVDATAGNGVDTEFLARAVGENGVVLAFDVQDEALRNTRARLERFRTGAEDSLNGGPALAASDSPTLESGALIAENVRLIKDNHARLAFYLTPYLAAGLRVNAAMYNLGFLPGGSAPLTTLADDTLASLEGLLPCLAPGAVISVHCYAGHERGEEETAAVAAWAGALPWREWRVLRYEFCNKPSNPETLFIVSRK